MSHSHGGATAEFRLLCPLKPAGEILDSDISSLQTQTHTQISLQPPLPNYHARVITIRGDTRVTSHVTITQNGVVETTGVSNAQKGLLMVFERTLEKEKCSLLVRDGEVGWVIGKKGSIVKAIEKQTRACIRRFKDYLPPFALPGDEIIQITGQAFAVKKALLAVSRRLQPWVTKNPEHHGNYCPRAPLSCGVSLDTTNDQCMRLDLERDLNFDGEGVERQVSFRLLCPYDTAGGVIGKNADIIKAMESQTGASIRFSAPLDASRERVATIISIEKPDPMYSPAQVAVNLVFTRSIEVKGMDEAKSVEARVLVGPGEIDCLIDEAGRISADIKLASGIEIQLLGADFAPSCANDNDIVVQLTGGFPQVKETLYQITGRLRKTHFSKKVYDREGWGQHPHSSTTSNNFDGRGTTVSSSSMRSFSGGQNTLGYSQKFAVHSPRLPHEMFKTSAKVVERDHIISEVKQSDVSIDTETTKTVAVEMDVPEQSFPNVYGENGINLARLKEISGATIIVHNPRPGESGGKVGISGTVTQVQIAQSLLQAFILF